MFVTEAPETAQQAFNRASKSMDTDSECRTCGRVFTQVIGRRGRQQIYCSWECIKKRQRTWKEPTDFCECGAKKLVQSAHCRRCFGRYKKPYKLAQIMCPSCRREFQPISIRTKFCSKVCHVWWQRKDSEPKELRVRQDRRKASQRRRDRGSLQGRRVLGRWRDVCARDGWVCWICQRAIEPTLRPPQKWAGTADHVVPVCLGGSDDDSNLRAAHFSCNSKRCAGRILPPESVAYGTR